MTNATITTFENAVQTANAWLHDVNHQLGSDDTHQAYRILRAGLVALRDRLTVEEATDLCAQLPLLIRGAYYGSWNPSKTPTAERTREDFLEHVAEFLEQPVDGDPERAVRAVFHVLAEHVTDGQIDHVKSNLPAELNSLWPE